MTDDRERATIAWRRLDVSGHDVAELARSSDGWDVRGVAVLAHEGAACRLDYVVHCDARWTTRRCLVTGFVGARRVRADITRDSRGRWTMNGEATLHLDGCDDIDLAFTPATNTLPIRRLALGVGDRADVCAAWLRFPELTLAPLEQTYARLGDGEYHYESAGGAFQRQLRVAPSGFVIDYPGLWIAEGGDMTESE